MGLQINFSVQLVTDQRIFPFITFMINHLFIPVLLTSYLHILFESGGGGEKEEKEIVNFEKHLNTLT